MNIFKSASKIVFLMLAVTSCIGFMLGKLPVENFMILSSGAFAFFFANKGDKSNEYLGK